MDKLKKQSISNPNDRDIFDRMKAGEPIRLDDPEYYKVQEVVNRTIELSAQLNTSKNIDRIKERLSEIIGAVLDKSTAVFAPFYTNFGRFIQIGKNVFINHACSFLDMGGITIEDHVLIGPRVNLVTENHPLNPADRRALICKPILIKRNAWIGAAATILPGVTIGENAVVAAGAVVSKDVPANTVVGGIPAKIIKSMKNEL
ncbi:MAG TPA: DapH/DapD/GlmU-related protein [Chitinophagaceae bacterium]|jgi:acetyltransferase-like isoleucine patch superfamily enzyme|nr:DapH/DapD/GlmU-related protein [Chitinophagaceae bacterium]